MARRRTTGPSLAWALLISLLINHGLILPGAYLLLTHKPPDPPQDSVVEVALVPQPPAPELQIEPPAPTRPLRVTRPMQKKPEEKKPEEQKKPEEKKPEEQKKTEEKKPEPVQPPDPTMRLKMVEVNNPESDRAPDNARFLSDKNRRVEQETRARHTNLVKDHPRPEPLSTPSARQEPVPGSKKHQVAEQREQEARRHQRQQKQEKVSPLLSMRRPAPQSPQAEQKELARRADTGDLPRPRPAQRARPTSPRPQLNLDHRSHDRIYGEEARQQRELARLSPSTPRGRHEKKWQRIRSALENFIPEVRPGNQTALGTRANPFALYIARMHRGIHRLWGYGFLVDLDNKRDGHPMNNMQLWAMIEVVVKPDGTVDKATIVKPSGILPYDVAALDTVFASGPYPPTPRAIRSADGKVYLHWRFHRDQRQCGTFGVDPYVLITPPRGPIDGNMAEVGKGTAAGQRRVRRLNRPAGAAGAVASKGHHHQAHAERSSKGAGRNTGPTRETGAARHVAERFVGAFRAGDTGRMAGQCRVPFLSTGRKVASSRSELRRMFGDLIREAGRGPSRIGRLTSVMQARSRLGRLPPGADYGTGMLVGQATLGGTAVTLLLQQAKNGRWQVVGLNR